MRPIIRFALIAAVTATVAGCDRSAPPAADTTATNLTATTPAGSPPAVSEASRPEVERTTPTTGTRNETPAVTWREVTIPAGTTLPVVLDSSIGSDTSRIEDPVRAHVSKAIMVDGVAAVPAGSVVTGVVTDAQRPGKVKGTGHISVRFDTLVPQGDERYRIHTSAVGRTAPAQKKKDALEIGAPAAGGAIVGGIIGGKKGAAIGAAAGGGAGTAVVVTQRGQDARLGKGAVLTLRLTEPVTVRIRG
jgi:hypothetical protein